MKVTESSEQEIKSKISYLKDSPYHLDLKERIAAVKSFAKVIGKAKTMLAEETSREIGIPISSSKKILELLSSRIDYLADNAKDVLKTHTVNNSENIVSHIARIPAGLVAVISPWNYPVDIPLSSIIPAFLAGNKIIFKPSEYASRVGSALGQLLSESLSSEYFQIVIGDKKVTKAVAINGIDMLSFTGTTSAAKEILKYFSPLSKHHFCLSGKDSMIVMPNVDIENTTDEFIYGAFRNNGANCSTIQRAFVHEQVYDKFIKLSSEKVKKLKINGPLEPETQISFIPSDKLYQDLSQVVTSAIANNYSVIRPEVTTEMEKMNIFPPTIIEATHDFSFSEKFDFFGPLAAIHKFSDIDQVVNTVNSSNLGLTSSVWCNSKRNALDIASKIKVGTVGINSLARSDIRVPWTGLRESGSGMIRSPQSILEFTNIKVFRIKSE